jgi:LCP family protein required for cell wall assembly
VSTTIAKKYRGPRWARLCVTFGSVLVVLSGGSIVGTQVLVNSATKQINQQNLLGSAKSGSERKHASITGAKNILLVGLDTRESWTAADPSRADSIILLHIPADKSTAYLISLPRDTYVHVPAYNNGKVAWKGGNNKINGAYTLGSQGLTGAEAQKHGFELLALTVKGTTGITPDAGAIVDLSGFKEVVDALGGICMYVDEKTTSTLLGTDERTGKSAIPYTTTAEGTNARPIRGVKPNVYTVGNHCFRASVALDYVRQRELLKDGDYGRQRHQQQFIKAVMEKVVKSGLTSPTKLPGLISAIGKAMTVDDGGPSLEDWVYAMRSINPSDLITIKTNDGKFNSTQTSVGDAEILSPESLDMLKAARSDTLAPWVAANPSWVSAS